MRIIWKPDEMYFRPLLTRQDGRSWECLQANRLNLNAIADNFSVTRQAISLHIKILTECGLIAIKQQGRERFCEPRFEKLNEVSQWIEQFRKYWDRRFDSLEMYLDKLQKERKHAKAKKRK